MLKLLQKERPRKPKLIPLSLYDALKLIIVAYPAVTSKTKRGAA
jgi:hypothetical protein